LVLIFGSFPYFPLILIFGKSKGVGGAWLAPFPGSDLNNNNSFFTSDTPCIEECEILSFPLLQVDITSCVTVYTEEDVEVVCGVVTGF
jgi:hypothetical protein